MPVLLALLAAIAYGFSDFAAGLASRRFPVGLVTASVIVLTLSTAVVAVVILPADSGPSGHTLAWGAISGLGSAVGTLALYHGLAVGRMSVVATLSAVLAAVIPVIVGLALGDDLSTLAMAGIAIAIPAIALTSWQPDGEVGDVEADANGSAGSGAIYGGLAGLGFALLFIALDQAGSDAGAWPVIPGQLVALLLVTPFALRGLAGLETPDRSGTALILGAGVLSGAANLLFLAATGQGQLAIIAVITSLYPAATVLLARGFLAERSTRLQTIGLLASLAAVILVGAG